MYFISKRIEYIFKSLQSFQIDLIFKSNNVGLLMLTQINLG